MQHGQLIFGSRPSRSNRARPPQCATQPASLKSTPPGPLPSNCAAVMGTAEALQRLWLLCQQTAENLDFARSAGFAPARQALLAKASANAGNKENGVVGQVEQLSSEVAKLQQSHSGLAAILHQSCTQLQRSQGSVEDVRRLQLQMDHLAGRVDAVAEGQKACSASPAPELEKCMSSILALQKDHALLAQRVQVMMQHQIQVPPTTDVQPQLEALEARLAADQARSAAQQGTALQQVGRRVDELAAQLSSMAQVGAQHATATDAMVRLEAQVQGLAAAQEQHAVQLQALSTSAAATAAASQSDGSSKQVQQLQQSLDDIAQLVFELRVEVQNSKEDMDIGMSSAKRQAEEAQQLCATAVEEAEGLGARMKVLEQKLNGLDGQMASLQQAVGNLATNQPADNASIKFDGGQMPTDVADMFRGWLQEELKGMATACAEQGKHLQLLTAQVDGLAVLPPTVSRLAASAEELQSQLEQLQQQQAAAVGASAGLQTHTELLSLSEQLSQHAAGLQSLEASISLLQGQQQQQQAAVAAAVSEGLSKATFDQQEAAVAMEGSLRAMQGSMEQHGLKLAALQQAVATIRQQAGEAAAVSDKLQEYASQLALLDERTRELEGTAAPVAALQGALSGLQQAVIEASSDRQFTAAQLMAVQERMAALEAGSAMAVEQLSARLAGAERQVADAHSSAQLQELSARVHALGEAAGSQPDGAVAALQRSLGEVEQGLQRCATGFMRATQDLEGRFGRMEATVAGALEEVARQMQALQAHVGEVEQRVATSAQHAREAAVAATLSIAQASQLVADLPIEGSAAFTSYSSGLEPSRLGSSWQQAPTGEGSTPAVSSAGVRRSSSGRTREQRRASGGGQEAGGVFAPAATAATPIEQLPVARRSSTDPPSGAGSLPTTPRREKSLRELYGSGGSSFSRRPSSSAPDYVQEQAAAASVKQGVAGELDEEQCDVLGLLP